MATASRPTAPLTERDLDHVCFLDWLARLSGYWQHPGHPGTGRVELDQGAVLRVTDAVGDEPWPLTLVDLLEQGSLCTALTTKPLRPLRSLAELRADRIDPRLLLEADLQRRRLYPRWTAWMAARVREDPDVGHSDMYILRFLPEIGFDDLAVMARFIRPIGPGMMWALFTLDAWQATQLFVEWVDAGEHDRFRELGGEFEEILRIYLDKPLLGPLGRVYQMMAEHRYSNPRIAGTP